MLRKTDYSLSLNLIVKDQMGNDHSIEYRNCSFFETKSMDIQKELQNLFNHDINVDVLASTVKMLELYFIDKIHEWFQKNPEAANILLYRSNFRDYIGRELLRSFLAELIGDKQLRSEYSTQSSESVPLDAIKVDMFAINNRTKCYEVFQKGTQSYPFTFMFSGIVLDAFRHMPYEYVKNVIPSLWDQSQFPFM